MPVITAIKHRRGTAAQWTSANPVLGAGEMGVETDTQKFKFGNGTTAWVSLGYGVGVNDPSGTTVLWTNVQGKPETFPPSAHTHATSDVTGLDTALSGKAAAVHTHTMSDITDLEFPPSTVVSDTQPTGVPVGTKWFKSSTAQEFIFFDSVWIEL